MARACRLEVDDVQRVIDAGSLEVDWVAQEWSDVNLSDQRLNRRLVVTARSLAGSPLSPINEACEDWASTQAAYRLFNNPKASPQAILAPHTEATAKRMALHGGPVLSLQDTVFQSFGQHPNTRGLGPIGKSNSADEHGLVMHNALAVTTSGLPLGVLSQRIWARREVPEEGYQEKIERLQRTPIEEKESSKWLEGLHDTVAHTPPGVQVITVADRESDCFEFIAEAQELNAPYLIRARTDRELVAEDSEACASLLEALVDAPVLGTMRVHIPGNGKRKARTARVELRSAAVTIRPPPRRGRAKALASTEAVSVNVLAVTEARPPKDGEALHWVLLTSLPVRTFTQAVEKVEWYALRWTIETWHKVMKSGCKVEDCRLETGERLARYLALFSVIAVRLMYVTHLARVNPEAPATAVFSREALEALQLRLGQRAVAPESMTLREAVRGIGRLGGHLGRKGDGEPGMTVLWRGWMRLHEDIEILRAYKRRLAGFDSS